MIEQRKEPPSALLPTLPSIVDVLRWRAEHQGERTAVVFLQDGTEPRDSLTYAELDRQARAIGASLQARMPQGERVMLCFPDGIEFVAAIFGCFYAGMVAVPAPPPDTLRMKRSLARLHAIHADAEPALLLAPAASEGLSRAFAAAACAYTSAIDERLACEWRAPRIAGDTLAYLQYTSGSTTTPKGVMISHSNLLSNLRELDGLWPYGPDAAVASWMPNFHDYGLVAGILRPLACGVPTYLSSPRAFLKRPRSWLEAIARFRVTHSGAATFAFNYCVQRIPAAEVAELDLSSWQAATVGAEPVRYHILRAFAERFASAGFRFETFCPGYGLAELTLFATGHANAGSPPRAATVLGDEAGRPLIGCGRASDLTTLIVVDAATCTRVPETVAGEIWIAGPSVALGYWRQPEATQAAFCARLADTGAGPFLRTGDIGFLRDGELFITGRLKHMLIIHGENYYAEELEWVAQDAHPRLRHHAAAAFGVPGPRTEQLVIVHELDRPPASGPDADALMAALRRSISEYFGVPVHGVALVRRGAIPRTSSGKVQRHECRAAYLDGTLAPSAEWRLDEQVPAAPEPPADGVVAQLIRIWQALLEAPVVTASSDFFDLGGDSLLSLQLTVAVEEQFGQTIPAAFFGQPTIRHLAQLLQPDGATAQTAALASREQQLQEQRAAPPAGSVAQVAADLMRVARESVRRLRRLVVRPVFWLPYLVGRRGLVWWVRQPWVQALLYRYERRVVSGFLAAVDHAPRAQPRALHAALAAQVVATRAKALLWQRDVAEIATYAAAFGSAGRFWAPYHRAAVAALRHAPVRPFAFVNSEVVQEIEPGRGVILVTYHSPYGRLALLALLARQLRSTFFLHRDLVVATAREQGLAPADAEGGALPPGALATHVQLARTCLRDGGMVVIAGDSQLGQGAPVVVAVHGRQVPFKTGFAELALNTGAVVVPAVISAEPDECVRITFHAPLDAGSHETPHAERVRSLVRQYAAFFEAAVREAPETLSLQKMDVFQTYPRVADEPAQASSPTITG